MTNTPTTLQQISALWVERQSALRLKGQKADRACFEFMSGAMTALILVGHPDAGYVRYRVENILANAPIPCGTVAGWALGEMRDAA